MATNNYAKSNARNRVLKVIFSAISMINMLLVAVFLQNLGVFFYYGAIVLSCVLFVFSVALNNMDKPFYKSIICANALVFLFLIIFIILDNFGLLKYFTDINTLEKLIKNAGIWGIFVLLLVTVLEVVVLPIPAAVTILLGAVLFGPTVSFVVSALGTIVGSIACFYIGRLFGYPVVSWIIGKESTEKYSNLLAEKGKLPFFLMMLFPFFPDDILCLVSGLTSMSFKFFIVTVLLTRPVMVAFYSYFGTGNIIPFNGWGIPVWIALTILVMFSIYLIKKTINKKKN